MSPSSPTPCQPYRSSTQLIQTRWSRACIPPLLSWQPGTQYPSSGCLLMWDWQEMKEQTDLQKSAVRLCRHGTLSPTDTSPVLVQWRLEKRKQRIPGTPWPNWETWTGPADHYLPPAHRALWSESPSKEDWHFRHFPVWVRTSWPNPKPRPSVLPKTCREMSANMVAWCWCGDQAVGLGRRPLPDGCFCGVNWTEDLTCTAVNRWRRRIRYLRYTLLLGHYSTHNCFLVACLTSQRHFSTPASSSSSSASPSYISRVHHFGWHCCVCDWFSTKSHQYFFSPSL